MMLGKGEIKTRIISFCECFKILFWVVLHIPFSFSFLPELPVFVVVGGGDFLGALD